MASTPETAVRNYLTYLDNPDALRDEAEVSRLEKAVTDAIDLVDQLMARAALRKAMALDPGTYELAFIEQAKVWADDHDVPAESFVDMGVREDVLEAAGFYGKATKRTRGPRKASAPSVPRRASVKADALEAGILALDGQFSVRDVTEKVGGSTITVTKVVKELEDQGKIKSAGERANERGRASRVWAVA